MTGPFLALLLAVTDGDTFRARLEVWPGVEVVTAVRLRGIDTPEIRGKCPAEKAAAQTAKTRLTELLSAGHIELRQVELDKYAGRVDAVAFIDGHPVSDTLISEGLARPYSGGARQGWCP